MVRAILLFLVLNAAAWALYATLGGMPVQHQDSLEAYAWGREFQFGYHKHPPLWAWVSGAWFSVVPRTDFGMYFLTELNASLGIVGAWFLMGRFVSGPTRHAAAALLLLTTLFTFNALRFNANTFPLSIWPWTMFFFVRSIERRTIVSGLLFGLFAGLAMLAKYYAGLLLATCFVAALLHRDRRGYFTSPAPYVAVLAFEAVFLPHVIWLVRDGFQPILYLLTKVERSDPKFVDTPAGFVLACLGYHAVQIVVLGATRLWKGRAFPAAPNHGWAFLLTLATGPFLLTLLAGLVSHMRVTPLYAVPIFSLTPLPLLLALRADPTTSLRVSKWVYGFIVAASLIAAPIANYVQVRTNPTKDVEPLADVTRAVEAAWLERTGKPLRLVAGSWPYAVGTVFYAREGVSDFTDFNMARAPWVTPERIRREGLLYVCLVGEDRCLGPATPWRAKAVEEREMTFQRTLWGAEAEPVRLIVGFVLPEE